jgi:hypothetical protein
MASRAVWTEPSPVQWIFADSPSRAAAVRTPARASVVKSVSPQNPSGSAPGAGR